MDDSLLDEIVFGTSQIQNKNDNLPNICCFCGKDKNKHQGSKHKFIPIKFEYRCIKCHGYLFEHRYYKRKCTFNPYKYM